MKKFNFFALLAVVVIGGCSIGNSAQSGNSSKTDNDKFAELIKDYAKMNIPDYNSFEIIEILDWDSAYSEIHRDKYIRNSVSAYNKILFDIEELQYNIQRLDNYISDINSDEDDIWNEWTEKTEIVVGRSFDGWSIYWGSTSEGKAYTRKVSRMIEKLNEAKSNAQAKKNQEDKHLKELLKQKQTIEDEIKTFSANWEKQYLGKSAQVKCRFKNEEGNMNIEIYDVLCNDSLSRIISIVDTIERHSFDEVKQFIIHCQE